MLEVINEILIGGVKRSAVEISHGYDVLVYVDGSTTYDPLMYLMIFL